MNSLEQLIKVTDPEVIKESIIALLSDQEKRDLGDSYREIIGNTLPCLASFKGGEKFHFDFDAFLAVIDHTNNVGVGTLLWNFAIRVGILSPSSNEDNRYFLASQIYEMLDIVLSAEE